MSRARCRAAAKVLEVAILRGPTGLGTVSSLSQRLVDLRFSADMRADRFAPRARRRLGKAEWAMAEELAGHLGAAIGPLEAMRDKPVVSVEEVTRRLADALDAAAGAGAFLDDRAGDALADLLFGLLASGRLTMQPREYPAFLSAAMAGVTVTPEPAFDPRIHIWGTLEARLQTVDLLVLGGLDEGVWPAEARTDAWLSRRMRNAIGLPPPERRIGLSAHDFCEAMAADKVIVSRAKRRAGTPTVASRWLQRIGALAGKERMDAMQASGDRYLSLARMLDAVPPGKVRPIGRPAPTPPIEARPRELSVTAIETLIRDPYAVYARRILQLEPLDPIGQRADPRLRGSLIHEAFADFTREWHGPFDRAARDRFLALWRQHFEAIAAYPEVHAVWLLRAEEIADWLIGWEAARNDTIASRHAEIAGAFEFDTNGGSFKLNARADRIDVMRDGRIGIYDYKTGVLATAKQVLLFQPQLALEGAMAHAGGFGTEFKDRPIAELAWVGVGRVGKGDVLRSAVDTDAKADADAVAAEAFVRLRRLIEAYENPHYGYVSQARPMFERRFPGDYDHLARVSEWRFAAAAKP
jgi:ATP-dependent helicase/nuclease subunit B